MRLPGCGFYCSTCLCRGFGQDGILSGITRRPKVLGAKSYGNKLAARIAYLLLNTPLRALTGISFVRLHPRRAQLPFPGDRNLLGIVPFRKALDAEAYLQKIQSADRRLHLPR